MYKTRWTFFSLLYVNNQLRRSWFLLGFEAVCKVLLACYVGNYKMSWLQTPDRSPPFKNFWSKQKSEHDLSSEEKNNWKRANINRELFPPKLRAVTVIYLTLFIFLNSVLSNGVAVLGYFCALIPETLDFKGLRQFVCKLWASSIDIAVR